jgi:hypothetical protein
MLFCDKTKQDIINSLITLDESKDQSMIQKILVFKIRRSFERDTFSSEKQT